MSRGSCWPSPSTWTATVVAVLARVEVARLNGAADPEVERQDEHARAGVTALSRRSSSVEPSSITSTSNSGAAAWISLTVVAIAATSL